jgi:O-antigen/teichoic acid export membrane protein
MVETVSLRRSGLISGATGIVRTLVVIATVPLLIRAIGISEYGLWSVLVAFSGLSLLVDIGLGSALTVFVAERTVKWSSQSEPLEFVAITLVTASGVMVACGWLCLTNAITNALSVSAADRADFVSAMNICALATVPRLWQQLLAGLEAGLSRYDLQAQGEILGFVVLNVGVVVLARFGYRLTAFSCCYFVSALAATAYHFHLIRKTELATFRTQWDGTAAYRLLQFGWAYWLSNVGGALYSRADRIIIGALLGPGAVGVYSTASSITTKIGELASLLLRPLTPAVSAASATNNTERIRRMFLRSARLDNMLVYVMLVAFLCSSRWIPLYMVGHFSSQLTNTIIILSTCYAVYSINAVGYLILLGFKSTVTLAVWQTAGAAATLLSMWWFASHADLYGATASNGAFAVALALNVVAARRLQISSSQLVRLYAPFFAGIATCVLCRMYLGQSADVTTVLPWAIASLGLCYFIDRESVVAAQAAFVRWSARPYSYALQLIGLAGQ